MTQKNTSPKSTDMNLAQAILHDLGRSSLKKDGQLMGKSDVEIRRAGLKDIGYTLGVAAVGAAAVVGGKLWIDHQEAKFANDDQGIVQIDRIDSVDTGEQHILTASSLPAGVRPEVVDNSTIYVVPKAT